MYDTTRRNNGKYDVYFSCKKEEKYYSILFKQSPRVKYGFSTHFRFSLKMEDPVIEKDGNRIRIRDRADTDKSIIFSNDARKKIIKFNLKDYSSSYELSSKLAQEIYRCLSLRDNENIEFECAFYSQYKNPKSRTRKSNKSFSKTLELALAY